MHVLLQPWQLLLAILAAQLNRRQQQQIDYQQTEIETLLERLRKYEKRILLNDDQRRRLAVKGKRLGRKALSEVCTLFTPDTILRWHRQLVAAKWNYSVRRRKVGRPSVGRDVEELVIRLARENLTWGYDRIQGTLANLGYSITDTTVGNILKRNGLERSPNRKRLGSWSTFLKAHWDVMAATDFTTVEVWGRSGLVTVYLLFVMELKTRRVHFAGCTTNPNGAWMKQTARELTGWDGCLNNSRYLIMDRDTKFCDSFQHILKGSGVQSVRLPPRSPNLNAHLERFMKSIKDECLSRMIFFGERSLRRAVTEYLTHYHMERNHQGLNNRVIEPDEHVGAVAGTIQTRERLGGLLNYYYRDAA